MYNNIWIFNIGYGILFDILLAMDSTSKVKPTSNYNWYCLCWFTMGKSVNYNTDLYVAWNNQILMCCVCAFLHFRFAQMKCSCDHCWPGFKLDYLAPIRFLTVSFLCAVLPHDSVQSQQQQQQQQHRPGAAQQNQPLHPRPASCYYRPGPGQTLSPVSTHEYANVCTHQWFGADMPVCCWKPMMGFRHCIEMSFLSDLMNVTGILYIHTYHVQNIINYSKIQSVKAPVKFKFHL